MSENITIPADVCPLIRTGAHDLIARAADAISTVAGAIDREDHPERYQAPFAWLARLRALLDAIGWARTEVSADVTLCFADQGTALCEAADSIFAVAMDALEQADDTTRESAAQRVKMLRDFGKALDGAVILLSRNDPRVQAFHKSADALLAELEAEGADYS